MNWKKVCDLSDLWEGDMASFDVDGSEVLILWPEGGEMKAFQGICPHQDFPLIDGKFDGKTLVCKVHHWVFDAKNGKGVNPGDCSLAQYPIRVENDTVFVDTSIRPHYAHT